MPTTLGKYQLGMTLGSGVSCKVKLAKDAAGTRYAVKVLHNDEAFLELIKAEVETLKNLKHPNIVNLIESASGIMSNSKKSDKQVDYLVLELVNGGDLFDYIANSGRFSEEVARYYFTQFMDALDYMHKNNCCHRDLKPENIMLDSEFNLKVADFGFAAPVSGRDGSGFLATQLGTQSYMAPEIHLNKPYTGPGVDLFAAAIILFVMMSQRPPFNSPKPDDPHYRLLAADRADLFWQAHDEAEGGESIYSKEFKDLFEKLTKLNPAQRITMEQLKQHPWYCGAKPSKTQIIQEFQTRKEEVDADAKNEREEKRAARAERRHGDTHRGFEELNEDEVEALKLQMENLKLIDEYDRDADENEEEPSVPQYDPALKKQTAFFTSGTVEGFTYDLVAYLMDEFSTGEAPYRPKVLGKEGKVKFTIPDKRLAQPIKVTVKYYYVDENKKYIEFNRRDGDQLVFLEYYRKMKASDKLKVYVDETLI